jgi:hypothetical protein
MTSERQNATNRANANKSTGPRTRAGKWRASKNARKHGLSLSLEGSDDVEALARLLAGDDNEDVLFVARIAGEAQLQLTKVRRHKTVLMDAAASAIFGQEPEFEAPCSDDRHVQVIPSLIKQLAACERYERRALSRRDKALRALHPPALTSCRTISKSGCR